MKYFLVFLSIFIIACGGANSSKPVSIQNGEQNNIDIDKNKQDDNITNKQDNIIDNQFKNNSETVKSNKNSWDNETWDNFLWE